MPFDLQNSPSTIMRFMNEVLFDYFSKFFVIYLGDILIFSSTKEEHLRNLSLVLQRLSNANVSINHEKCDFMKEDLVYLGFFNLIGINQDGS